MLAPSPRLADGRDGFSLRIHDGFMAPSMGVLVTAVQCVPLNKRLILWNNASQPSIITLNNNNFHIFGLPVRSSSSAL
jgi:hypothetical protein